MRKPMHKQRGFTLIELLIAMGLTVTIMLAGFILYQKSVQISELVSQRSTVQANSRMGTDTISQDLSQAGGGLPNGGIALPAGAKFGCSTTACGLYNYPANSGTPTLYGVIPGNALGPMINGGTATDVMTAVYTDREPDLDQSGLICPTTGGPGGFDAYPLTTVTLSPMTVTFNASTCPTPNNPGYGFQVGDLVMVSNQHGTIVQYVTSVSGNTLTFGADPFGINSTGTGTGSLASLFASGTLPPAANAATTTALKLEVVTYYLQIPNLGTPSQLPPRLMRQVNGLPPQPVAEQVNDLRFTYDIIDAANGNPNTNPPTLPLLAAQPNPTVITNIRKVNVKLVGVAGITSPNVPVQQVALTTSVSPRGLSYFDQYPTTNSGGATGF